MTATADPTVDYSGPFLLTNGLVLIGEQLFRCHSLQTSYVVNQIPVAEIVVIPDDTKGLKELKLPGTIASIYEALFKTNKGAALQVTFNISAPANAILKQKALDVTPTTLFKGRLLGWSPVWFGPRSLQMTIWAVHPLGLLDWCSSIIDPVHGSGFDDWNLPVVRDKDEELVPYMKGPYTKENVSTDLWKKVIKPELIKICEAKRFGEPNAASAVEYLKDEANDKSEVPLSWVLTDPLKVVLDVRNTLLKSGPGRRTLWDNLVELSETYKFTIIGRAANFSIAPIIPALGGADPKHTLYWQRYSKREEFNALARSITQSIGMLRGAGGLSEFFDVKARRLQGAEQSFRKLKAEKVVAGTQYFMVPKVLDFRYDPFFKTGNTLGLKDERLYAAGYCLKDTADKVDTLNTLYNAVPKTDLEKYANVVMNERAFDGFSAVFRGNVDFDVCPGNNVVIEPPLIRVGVNAEIGTPYFAHVWGVTMVFDPAAKTTGAYVILSHIRTKTEQAAIELINHPLYNKRWVSAPIVTIPGYTLEPDNAYA